MKNSFVGFNSSRSWFGVPSFCNFGNSFGSKFVGVVFASDRWTSNVEKQFFFLLLIISAIESADDASAIHGLGWSQVRKKSFEADLIFCNSVPWLERQSCFLWTRLFTTCWFFSCSSRFVCRSKRCWFPNLPILPTKTFSAQSNRSSLPTCKKKVLAFFFCVWGEFYCHWFCCSGLRSGLYRGLAPQVQRKKDLFWLLFKQFCLVNWNCSRESAETYGQWSIEKVFVLVLVFVFCLIDFFFQQMDSWRRSKPRFEAVGRNCCWMWNWTRPSVCFESHWSRQVRCVLGFCVFPSTCFGAEFECKFKLKLECTSRWCKLCEKPDFAVFTLDFLPSFCATFRSTCFIFPRMPASKRLFVMKTAKWVEWGSSFPVLEQAPLLVCLFFFFFSSLVSQHLPFWSWSRHSCWHDQNAIAKRKRAVEREFCFCWLL